MSVIAIVGAGPGLGAAVATKFGREGFSVALISRNEEKVTALEKKLGDDGITAKSYVADITDREGLAAALDKAADELGPIDALQFSPVPSRPFLKPVLETTAEDLKGATEMSILGTSTAFAGESAYGAMLHEAAGEKGVKVRQLIIPGAIDGGDPLYDSASLAERIWNLHTTEGPYRLTVGED